MGRTSTETVLRAQARADVAELSVQLKQEVEARLPEEDTHLIIIHAKKVLSVTEFKQMFYARGDDHFCLAQVYECPDNINSILSSVWGKKEDPCDPNSKVLNFNRLGGRHHVPNCVKMAYGYPHDNERTFFAQFEIMGNMERDLCIKREHWTTASRKEIEDQLYCLALVPERSGDLCPRVVCGRDWSEVEHSLVESHLAIGETIDHCENVDLYINVQVIPANKDAKPTIIRIRYTVNMKRKVDDKHIWNTRAPTAASKVISSGTLRDAPEGGKHEKRDASAFSGTTNYTTRSYPSENNYYNNGCPPHYINGCPYGFNDGSKK